MFKGIIYSLLSLISFFGSVYTATAQSDCLESVLAAYKKINEVMLSDADETRNVEIQSTTYYVPNQKQQVNQVSGKMNIYSNKKKLYYQTNDMEYFQDEQTAVLIMKQEKEIYINKVLPGNTQNYLTQMSLRDSILRKCKISECMEILENGQKLKKVAFQLPKNYVQLSHIQEIVFWLDEKTQSVKKFAYFYTNSSQIKKVELVILKQTTVTGSSILDKKVRDLVFNNKQLLPAYQSYKLTDNTKH